MGRDLSPFRILCSSLSLLFLLCSPSWARPFVLVLTQDDLKDAHSSTDESEYLAANNGKDSSDWEEFDDSHSRTEQELDPGSWMPIFEPSATSSEESSPDEAAYYAGVRRMFSSSITGDLRTMEEGVEKMEASAYRGYPPAQSVLGFLHQIGHMKERNKAKSFLYHTIAAEGGSMQSKMALAFIYSRQDMHDRAADLYAELAEVAVSSFLISKESHAIVEPARIHSGSEENKEALRKSRGEEDEDFQILEYQAQKGNAAAMYKLGLFYYFGLRGLRRDNTKALPWFLKAADKGEPRAMEVLGEIYAKGTVVERNYTKSLEWLRLASRHPLHSSFNGIGYLYVKGYGVEKNYTRAKEYFEVAADNKDAGGHYNLGVLYLKGIGVRRDMKLACNYFIMAANAGQPKAFYQLARMFHRGVWLKKNLAMATTLYKIVAERGPWSSLSRWALEAYSKGDVGTAFLLYARMGELGYEVAQSNAAWILDRHAAEKSICVGESGLCTEAERHDRVHSLWWQASEQGNEHAALLIGDAYYYGRGTERDYRRAAEAYLHAKAQSNAQAMFNLGYMHEHGQGLPLDLHLAKRYYDQAIEIDPEARLPVKIALACLSIRRNHPDTFLIAVIDSLPEVYPRLEDWIRNVLLEDANITILALFACLLTVLYLRDRHRRRHRHAAILPPPPPPN